MNISSSSNVSSLISKKVSSVDKELIGAPGVLEYLSTSVLYVDPDYQRKASTGSSKRHIDKIADNWDWRKVKCLNVAERKDSPGMYAIYDGQHTCMAARKRGIDKLPCYIIKSDSIADEANGFSGINCDRKNITSERKFNCMVISNDPRSTQLNSILSRHGVVLSEGKTSKPKHTQAIGALLTIMDGGSKCTLDDVLYVANLAWQGEQPSYNGSFLLGLWSFLSRVNKQVSNECIAESLGKNNTAKQVFQRAMLLSKAKVRSGGGVTSDIWREVFLDVYNYKKRTNRISFDSVTE